MADAKGGKATAKKLAGKNKFVTFIALAFLLIGVMYFNFGKTPADILGGSSKPGSGSFTTPNSRSSQQVGDRTDFVRSLPDSGKPVVRFSGEKQVVVDLKTDEWSQQVIIPVSPTKYVDCRIDVDPPTGYFVKFQDGQVDLVTADQREFVDHGMKRGIFRILGTSSGQKATITVFFRSVAK